MVSHYNLKARYYPNGNFEDTVFSGNASPTWHAIHYGLELLKKGLIWRVENGEHIRIWRDPWIPSSEDRKVITRRGQTVLSSVNDLIDPTSGEWDEDLIKSILNTIDVRRILQIPLNYGSFDDFIAWNPDLRV